MSAQNKPRSAHVHLDALIRESAPERKHVRADYWRLVKAIRRCTRLLAPGLNSGHVDHAAVTGILRACARIAKHNKDWREQPERWTAPSASGFVQFRSLLAHLFEEFPVPAFLVQAWTTDADKSWERDLYLHLAAGQSVRAFKLPLGYAVRLSKQEARWWMNAPHDLVPISAWRWAQVRALGGDERLAGILINTPALLIPTKHEDFWQSVIRFLIREAPISHQEIEAIVRFIDRQKFQPGHKVWGRGAGPDPLQPEFSLRGRTLMSLRRHMTNWREDLLAKAPHLANFIDQWSPSNIAPFRYASGGVLWTIDELLSDRELRVEGGMMRHCVATYSYECARRQTSIWSMKKHDGRRRVRTLTIEVLPRSRTIFQALGKRNAVAAGVPRDVLNRWAEQEGLSISADV